MRAIIGALVLTVFSSSAFAAPGEGRKGERQRDPERMQKILEQFDADGDGKLSQDERAAAREARAKQRGNRPEGARRAGGPMGDPAAMFKQADTDGNGQLSQQEFMAMIEKMRAARGGPRGERGARGRGPEGRRRPPADEIE